jgi:hypothetical protein
MMMPDYPLSQHISNTTLYVYSVCHLIGVAMYIGDKVPFIDFVHSNLEGLKHY